MCSAYYISLKKDGFICFCVHYQKLNEISVMNSCTLPRMEERMDWFHGARDLWTQEEFEILIEYSKQRNLRHKSIHVTSHSPWLLAHAVWALKCHWDVPIRNERHTAAVEWKSNLILPDYKMIFSKSLLEQVEHVQQILGLFFGSGDTVKVYFIHGRDRILSARNRYLPAVTPIAHYWQNMWFKEIVENDGSTIIPRPLYQFLSVHSDLCPYLRHV